MMDIEFKNGSYIHTIPCGDTKRPVRMVYENVPIKTEKEYLESIAILFNNIGLINPVSAEELKEVIKDD